MGLEGSIVRNYDGLYKFNRSTLREGLLLKVKNRQTRNTSPGSWK